MYIQEDFDDFNRFHTYRDRPSMCMMLGNTMTNFIDMQRYLSDLFALFHDEDMLLLGVEINNNANNHSFVEEYNTPENRTLTFMPLAYIGIPQSVGYVDISRNSAKGRIEEWFIFQKCISLDGLVIPKDTKILLSITNKPTLDEIIAYIEQSKFQIIHSHHIQEQYIFCLRKASGRW